MSGNPDCNVNRVVLVSAECRGRRDYQAGVKVGDNPFDEHDESFWRWMKGWSEAGMEALEITR